MSAAALQTFLLAPAADERIVGDHLPGSAPGYLFLHGLGSIRAGEKSTALLQHARARGRACTRFDFRGHGASSGRIGFTTVSELIADTGLLLDRFGRSILVGSSLGGLVAAFVAVRRPADVHGLVLLAPALGFLHRMERRLDADGWLRSGDGVAFPVHRRVLDDARTLDEIELPSRITVPLLLVHGSDDAVVPKALSQRFFAAVPAAKKQLWLVPHGDHRLNQPILEILRRMDALLG